jgi:hypothetical protein
MNKKDKKYRKEAVGPYFSTCTLIVKGINAFIKR